MAKTKKQIRSAQYAREKLNQAVGDHVRSEIQDMELRKLVRDGILVPCGINNG